MNIIDSLVQTITLDDSKFQASIDEINQQSVKLRKSVKENADTAEDAVVKSVDESFRKVTRQVLQLFFLFLGARSIRDFADSAVKAETALGIISQALGSSPERISAFDQAVERIGGTSEGANSSLGKFNSMIKQFNLDGSAAPAWFYRIGGDKINPRAGRVEQFVQLSQLMQTYRADIQTKFHILEQLGLDRYTAEFLLLGPEKVLAALADTAPTAVTAAQVASGQQQVGAWARASQGVQAFGREVLRLPNEHFASFLDSLSSWTEKNKDGWLPQFIAGQLAPTISDDEWQKPVRFLRKIMTAAQLARDAISSFVDEWEAVDRLLGTVMIDSFMTLVNLARRLPDALWAVVNALRGVVRAFSEVLGFPITPAMALGSAPSTIRARGSHAPTGHPSSQPAGPSAATRSAAALPLPGEAGAPLSLPLETVEGPVSMGRPLPVKMAVMPQQEDTFGGLIGKLFEKGGKWLQGAMPGGGPRGGGGLPYTGPQGPPSTKGLDPGLLAKITSKANEWGIDPNIAVRVWQSEGPTSTLNFMQPGDYVAGKPTSGGPFQFHTGGAGSVGTEYERATGYSVYDPSHIDQYLDFTFKWVRQNGWGPWHGAARVGIYGKTGVRNIPPGGEGLPDPRPHNVPDHFTLPTPAAGPPTAAPSSDEWPKAPSGAPKGHLKITDPSGLHTYPAVDEKAAGPTNKHPELTPLLKGFHWKDAAHTIMEPDTMTIPKPAADNAAAAARTSTLIKRSEFNVAHLQVNSRSATSAGVAQDIRVALQRELEMNLGTA